MIITSFLGPFLLNFIIWMLILRHAVSVAVHVDDLMGKGLEWNIILELLTYASANWVPLALPFFCPAGFYNGIWKLREKKNDLLALEGSQEYHLFKIMRAIN